MNPSTSGELRIVEGWETMNPEVVDISRKPMERREVEDGSHSWVQAAFPMSTGSVPPIARGHEADRGTDNDPSRAPAGSPLSKTHRDT